MEEGRETYMRAKVIRRRASRKEGTRRTRERRELLCVMVVDDDETREKALSDASESRRRLCLHDVDGWDGARRLWREDMVAAVTGR